MSLGNVYPLGNTSVGWHRQINENIRERGVDPATGRTLFPGGTIYAARHKAEYPDSQVDVVEPNTGTAFLQAFAVDRYLETRDPSEVRKDLFLEHFTEGDREGVEPFVGAVNIPKDEVKDTVERQRDFANQSDEFDESVIRDLHEDYDSVYRSLVDSEFVANDIAKVDLGNLNTDIYLHLFDEIDEVQEPDNLYQVTLENADVQDADIIYGNNVIDWVESPIEFAEQVDRVGSDEGYFVSMYTSDAHYSFDSQEELVEVFEDVTGKHVSSVDLDIESSMYGLDLRRSRGEVSAEYIEKDIVGGENAALLEVG